MEFELGSIEAIKLIVGAGLGLGCLSRLAAAEAIASGWLVEVKTTLPRAARVLSIVVHRERRLRPDARGFVDHCLATDAAWPKTMKAVGGPAKHNVH